MRNVLRGLILWSKQKSRIEEEDYSITYGAGFMEIIQRLITITQSDEDAFLILAGMIKAFPRPFSANKSILLDGKGDSLMRYEMTAFKALIQ